jgi:hypothetical protein
VNQNAGAEASGIRGFTLNWFGTAHENNNVDETNIGSCSDKYLALKSDLQEIEDHVGP